VTLFLNILLWIGIVLAGTIIVILWLTLAFAVCHIIGNLMDRIFGDGWMS
jgi:hypothetical protein